MSDAPFEHPDDLAVLAAVLRSRPPDVAALRASAPLVPERVDAALERLAATGMIIRDDDRILAPPIERALLERAQAMLARQHHEVDALAGLLELLPRLLDEERRGAGAPDALTPNEVVHGRQDAWKLWMRLMSEAPPRAPISMFPELPTLADTVIAGAPQLTSHRERLGFTMRLIVAGGDLDDAASRERLRVLQRQDVQVRVLASLPGWLYADAGVVAAVPLEWGQATPESVLLVREPAIVDALASYLESLWDAARPIQVDRRGWDPVLELLAEGLSDGAIGEVLGVSLRTVRRRISDAAEHFGAPSRFALGAAWQRSREPRS